MWMQVLPNAVSNQDIDRIISLRSEYKIETGKTENGDAEKYRRSKLIYFHPDHELWLFNIIGTIAEWGNQFFKFDLDQVETAQYTEYDASYQGKYDWHIDSYNIHTDMQRKLSMTIQLSDENEYEGGDFVLEVEPDSKYNIKQKGTAIIFPSYLRHKVTPVTKGNRKSLVSWIQGREFK